MESDEVVSLFPNPVPVSFFVPIRNNRFAIRALLFQFWDHKNLSVESVSARLEEQTLALRLSESSGSRQRSALFDTEVFAGLKA